ncbi:unnamed protein product [Haemonchus placei]|uniref:Cadherin domain-containing protein n=1 Tax=Haemonchus placei TaxID=6290 RepID=A0A0N4VV89_HAEPC|nr:unnamed protein product [Haemonchus placei]
MQGITGKLSGKMGSAVFRIRNGAQVVTQYNPIVKNPDTAGQQEARAKFKLLSQLGAIMESGFGTMAVTKRAGKSAPTQRNAFMQLNYRLVAVDMSSDVPERAKIKMDKVQLTKSARPLGEISGDASEVSVLNVPDEVKSVRFVEVVYRQVQVVDPDTGSFIIKVRPEVKKVQDTPVTGTGAERGVSYEPGVGETLQGSTILAYGLIPTASTAGRVDFDNIHTPSDEDFVGAIALDQMVRDGDLLETMTIGLNVQGGN